MRFTRLRILTRSRSVWDIGAAPLAWHFDNLFIHLKIPYGGILLEPTGRQSLHVSLQPIHTARPKWTMDASTSLASALVGSGTGAGCVAPVSREDWHGPVGGPCARPIRVVRRSSEASGSGDVSPPRQHLVLHLRAGQHHLSGAWTI